MANYSLIINSKFRPFEYQELLAPVLMATQAHQALEDAYADLQTKASIWDRMTNEATDPRAHAMYQKYADDLEGYANALSRYGLNPTSRRDMLEMRSRYAKDITPIENAYKKREEQAKEQRVAMMNNPTLLLSRRASQTSLDDYIDNPNLDYDAYSGALITQQVATAASNIAKEARDSEEGRRRLRQIIPYQYELVQQKGFSREAVMDAIMNSPNANRVLLGLVEGAINTSGVKNWGDSSTIERAYDYARQGLYSAIGDTSYQMVTDSAGLQRNQYDLADRNNARQYGRQVAENKRQEAVKAREAAKQRAHELKMQQPQQVTHTTSNPVPLFSQNQIDERQKEVQKWVNKGFLTKNANGEYGFTPRGLKEASKTKPNLSDALARPMAPNSERRLDSSDFGNFIRKNRIGKGYKKNDNFSINSAIQDYLGNTNLNDAYRTTGFINQIDVKNKQALLRASGKNGLDIVEFNGKNGYKKVGTMSRSELAKHDTQSMFEIGSGMHGTTYQLIDKDGNIITVAAPGKITLPNGKKVPGGAINPTTENMKTQSLFSAAINAAAYESGYDLERDASGNVVFDDDGNPVLSNRQLNNTQRQRFYDNWLNNKDNYEVYRASDIYSTVTKPSEYNTISGMQ